MKHIKIGVGQWGIERSNEKRQELMGQSNPKGYSREPLIHLEPSSCPPDLLHMKKGVILKQINQVFQFTLKLFKH